MLVDGGFGDLERHEPLLVAGNHSLILVDGEGPELWRMGETPVGVGTEAFLRDGLMLEEGGGFLEARAEYAGAAITRQVWMDPSGVTLVRDQLQPLKLSPREYRTLWHSGTTELTLTDGGGRFDFPGGASLQVLVRGRPVDPLRSSRKGLHTFTGGEIEEHEVLVVTLPGSAHEQLTLLVPGDGTVTWLGGRWQLQQGTETLRLGPSGTFPLVIEGARRGFALGSGTLQPEGLAGVRIVVRGDASLTWSRTPEGGTRIVGQARPGAGPGRVLVTSGEGEQVLQLPRCEDGAGPGESRELRISPP